ncbi:NAD(P)/FAD-dependent oxidoreductase [Streptomyces sp. NBC_00687]|uniref:NAD(P)/FAD-dependent oxidoreductase n=1 Tax=Streptomyces sp. NBC_00687 TaxID=2975807 RepID=UPI0022581C05|nr:FAD-dependent oxidoreductase [Streptomyces sp. NBC_00687]MCX4919954.1 FAD-dependent oxidoreductase [Streptomyces sp. NBC_00687]
MNTSPQDTDVLVIGAGPAGISAAIMAVSLGLQTVIVEAAQVGGKLHAIGALENVPGNWSTGPQLAAALVRDLARLESTGRCAVLDGRAVRVGGFADRAEVGLSSGEVLVAQTVVVATGVSALMPSDVDWISTSSEFTTPPLWRAAPEELVGRTYVLGGDRPLGTWLRAHRTAQHILHVVYPPADDYKVDEVRDEPRVRLVPASQVTVTRSPATDSWVVEVTDRVGERKSYAASVLLNNLGSQPAALGGLTLGADGYAAPEHQHPRIRIAGDLRAAQFQRISTAQGSGAEAALAHYYSNALLREGGVTP